MQRNPVIYDLNQDVLRLVLLLRTEWNDLLGHYCPRFGMSRMVRIEAFGHHFHKFCVFAYVSQQPTMPVLKTLTMCPHLQVAVPLPQPKAEFFQHDEYKIQLAFDGEVFGGHQVSS